MAFELAVYGAVSGYLYSILPRKKWMVYVVLIISMIAGRLVWGLVQIVIAGLSDRKFTTAAFLAGTVTGSIPGIILHIVLIPIIVIVMERAGLSLNKPRTVEK